MNDRPALQAAGAKATVDIHGPVEKKKRIGPGGPRPSTAYATLASSGDGRSRLQNARWLKWGNRPAATWRLPVVQGSANRRGMTDLPPWTLPQLETYVEIALSRMADNRDVMTDAAGQPIFTIRKAGRTAEGKCRIDLVADLSGIGMPTNAPLSVIAETNGPVSWLLGDTLIAALPGEWMPEEAGEALDMDKLLAAHRSWVSRSARGGGLRR